MSNLTVVDLAEHYNAVVSRGKIVAGQIKVLKVTESKTKGLLTAVIRIDRHHGLSTEEIKNFTGRRFINQRVDFDPNLSVPQIPVEDEEPEVTPPPVPEPEPEPEPEVPPEDVEEEEEEEPDSSQQV